ncbi:aminotransferase class V-fold PLP-dependent enzyme [Pseudonocardia sp. TRM90224]|uniref:aminotransferase class V-fold PLP-dependent enzyme n=1 Tax=Pseudonocardia sp. TRM90224 TaxID=2812678 RepID=UPI001E608FE9|nr:aminotransferase class V-fold PLP-dependent enzyme [Pseudonocardia sp. TRM90224]
MRNYRVTGPVDVPPEVLAAMTTPVMSHRSAAFRTLLRRVSHGLGPLFGTDRDVIVLTCSGTGGLEAAARSVLRPGDRVLSVQIGYFGERFAEIARHAGAQVDVLSAPLGEVVDPAEVAARAGGYDAVLLTHNETSTGVLGPLRAWSEAVRSAGDALLLVDVVSSLAAAEIAFDELGIDVAVGVTQKALACPPGLALVAVSERALRHAGRPGSGAYYLDLVAAADAARSGTTTWTPAMPQLFALDAALDAVEREGVAAVRARHEQTALTCREALATHGLQVVPRAELCSPTVTAVRLPGGDAEQLRDRLASEFDVWVSSGRAAWRHDVLRIGHMGPVAPAQVQAAVESIAALARPPAPAAPVRRGRSTPSTRVVEHAAELGPGWDELCSKVDAVLYQQLPFVRAYEAHPVAAVTANRYVEIRDGADHADLRAAAPLYRQADPLGLLGLAPGQEALLSAMWHCPDTRVLARDTASLDPLVEAIAGQADALGCPLFGFVNVEADSPAVPLLVERGLHRRELVPRWLLETAEYPDPESYVSRLRKPVRHELRRQLRRAAEQGVSTVEHGPDHPQLVELLRLVAATAARAGSPRYYDPDRLAGMLRQVGPACRLLEIVSASGETLGVGVCFQERDRLQYWAAGYVRDRADLTFSPYWALWWAVLELGWSAGVKVVECGRLNERFKIRMGLRPQPLVALMSRP